MNTISASQMMRLAMALEGSAKNFIWVVRPPIGFDINSEFRPQEWLPKGLEEKISKRGLLVHTWALQVDIYLGVFDSLRLELGAGSSQQWSATARLANGGGAVFQCWGCVEVARVKKCEVRCEDLAEKIELVMSFGSEKGNEMRRKSCEVKEMIKNGMQDEINGLKGSSSQALDESFSAAMAMKNSNA